MDRAIDYRTVLVINNLLEQYNVGLNLFDLSKETVTELLSNFELREYKKKSILSNIGNNVPEFFIVIEGIISNYYEKEGGKQDYFTFVTQKNITGSWETEFLGRASEHAIKAETDVLVVRVVLSKVKSFFTRNPDLINFYYELLPRAMAYYTFNIQKRYNQKPEERYETLLESEPEVIKKVPARVIASYLGIAPESFSRMKRRLEDGNGATLP